jgi:hypothetical protein
MRLEPGAFYRTTEHRYDRSSGQSGRWQAKRARSSLESKRPLGGGAMESGVGSQIPQP